MKKPNKVQFQYLYFNPPLGGVENYFLAGGKYCRQNGIQASILASQNPRMPAPDQEGARGLLITRHPYFTPFPALVIFRPHLEVGWIESYISGKCGDIDLFLSRHPAYAIAAKNAYPDKPVIFIPPDLRCRRIGEQLGGSLKDRFFYYLARPQINRIEREAVLSAKRVITLSLNLKRQFENHHRLPSDRIEVLPPGVDTERFHPRPPDRQLLGELGIDPGAKVVLTVSRLSPEKNLPLLLDAFSLLETESARLLIVGEGDERGCLEHLAGELGISGRVRFAGRRIDLAEIYPLASVFVLPSVEEPFGQVYLEAMASGLPCIGLKNDPPRTLVATEEIISDGEEGFTVESGNPGTMARKIDALLSNDDLRNRMGDASVRKCRENFNWEAHFNCIFIPD